MANNEIIRKAEIINTSEHPKEPKTPLESVKEFVVDAIDLAMDEISKTNILSDGDLKAKTKPESKTDAEISKMQDDDSAFERTKKMLNDAQESAADKIVKTTSVDVEEDRPVVDESYQTSK